MAFELTFVGIKDAIQNGLKTVEVLGFEFLMLSLINPEFPVLFKILKRCIKL